MLWAVTLRMRGTPMPDFGPDSFESAPPVTGVDVPLHRAWAEVDLSAIEANIGRLAEAAPTAEVMAVVKADGYGHGLIPSARASRRGGAQWLGVALLEEAIALRDAGDSGPILAWLPVPGDKFFECVSRNVDLGVSAPWMLTQIAQASAVAGRAARIHLKIDTGLGRSGAAKADWSALVREALAATRRGEVEVVGIWSHLAYADSPDHPTIGRQVEEFEDAIATASRLGLEPQYRHLANSAATWRLPQTHYDIVRPGISVYGISPGEEVGTASSLGLRPAMTLGARIVMTKRLPAGSGISYAHQYTTERETTVVLVPLGYADGIPRSASGRGPIRVAGKAHSIAGRVCMDQFVVDVGDDLVRDGDEVVLFGPGDRGEVDVNEWAQQADTIGYEIVTRIGPRVPRIYVGGA